MPRMILAGSLGAATSAGRRGLKPRANPVVCSRYAGFPPKRRHSKLGDSVVMKGPPGQPSRTPPPQQKDRLVGSTIALVDDDRNILTSVSMTLEAEGFTVRTYADGADALK